MWENVNVEKKKIIGARTFSDAWNHKTTKEERAGGLLYQNFQQNLEHLIRIVFSVTSFSKPIEQMSFVVQMTFALKFEHPKLPNP